MAANGPPRHTRADIWWFASWDSTSSQDDQIQVNHLNKTIPFTLENIKINYNNTRSNNREQNFRQNSKCILIFKIVQYEKNIYMTMYCMTMKVYEFNIMCCWSKIKCIWISFCLKIKLPLKCVNIYQIMC